MRLYQPTFLLFLFLLIACGVKAQTTVSGRVIDADSKTPVPFATVFINSTSIGTRTLEDGSFTLNNVKNGKYTVIISSIGYAALKQEVFVKGETIDLKNMYLEPTARQLSEVKIKPRKEISASKKKYYLNRFLKEFLGRTDNASQCTLTNPEILDFDVDEATRKFSVTSPGFLLIENNALGYKIKYLLQSFMVDEGHAIMQYTGFSTYEDMPGTPAQKEAWTKNRAKAYLGSQMHFFRSCIANQVPENEFTVYDVKVVPTPNRPTDSLIKAKINRFNVSDLKDSLRYWTLQQRVPAFIQQIANKPLDANRYIKLTDIKGIFAFTYPQKLLINYRNKKNVQNAKSTIVTFLQEEAYFDANGVIASPLALKNDNYWGKLRLADALPHDYELPQSIN